jgi:hypothetical protein
MGLLAVLVLACINSFAQNGTPQWKVVKAIQVTQGTAQVPVTTLFVPTKIGAYRYTAYIACYGGVQDNPITWWTLATSWSDSTGAVSGVSSGCNFQFGNQYSAFGPLTFTPKPGVPIQFQLVVSNPPPVDSTYTFWFTIEHLE